MQVAHTVADQNFDGAPDLFLYGSKGLVIWFVEVKSAPIVFYLCSLGGRM